MVAPRLIGFLRDIPYTLEPRRTDPIQVPCNCAIPWVLLVGTVLPFLRFRYSILSDEEGNFEARGIKLVVTFLFHHSLTTNSLLEIPIALLLHQAWYATHTYTYKCLIPLFIYALQRQQSYILARGTVGKGSVNST